MDLVHADSPTLKETQMKPNDVNSWVPKESAQHAKWFEIPSCDGYLVNDSGHVLNVSTGNISTPPSADKDYHRVWINKSGQRSSKLVHRLVCEAFYGPRDSIKFYVNHKNGKKTDNRPSNLEWCTPRDNNVHAIYSGLNKGKSGRSLKVLDIETKDVYEFESKAELLDFIPDSSLSGIFNSIKNENIYKFRYFITDTNIDIDSSIIENLTTDWFRIRYLTDKKGSPDIVITSVTTLAKRLSLSNRDFEKQLQSGKRVFGFIEVKRFNDRSEWLTDDEIDIDLVHNVPDVVIFSRSEKKYFIFRNVNSASKYFNLPANTIFRKCRSGNTELTSDLLVKFLSSEGPLTFEV